MKEENEQNKTIRMVEYSMVIIVLLVVLSNCITFVI